MTPRLLAILTVTLSACFAAIGCSNTETGDADSDVRAACEGPPLRNLEARNQAMEDGYTINPRYNCIDKNSFASVKEQRERWEAANTPEAKAQIAMDREKKIAQERALTAATIESNPRGSGQASMASAQFVRCTSSDGARSILRRAQCADGEITTLIEPVTPLMKRSESNTALIKCTSRDGKKVSIQRGNCASPEDYQQVLGDR